MRSNLATNKPATANAAWLDAAWTAAKRRRRAHGAMIVLGEKSTAELTPERVKQLLAEMDVRSLAKRKASE